VRWVRKRDAAGRVLALPNQTPGLIEQHGLTRADADRTAWTIDPEGTRLSGAAAVSRVLRELPSPWPRVARLYRLPPVAWVERGVYGLVARNRSLLSRWWGDAPPC
jgi:predicted DCC family thiol-disulfide oxidoreductase YuxK